MPWVQQFCCCCKLQTGAMVMGVLTIGGGIYGIFVAFFYRLLFRFVGLGFESLPEDYVNLVFNVLNIIVGALLVVGAVKELKWFIIPYLVTSLVYIPWVITFLTIKLKVRQITQILEYQQLFQQMVLIILVITSCIVAGISIYFWIAVFSYFQELRDRNRGINNPIL